MNNDVTNLKEVFSLAIKENNRDRNAILYLMQLEEKLIKLLENEFSGDETDNGARG